MKLENAAGEWDAQIPEKFELLTPLAFQPKPNNVLGGLSAGRRVYSCTREADVVEGWGTAWHPCPSWPCAWCQQHSIVTSCRAGTAGSQWHLEGCHVQCVCRTRVLLGSPFLSPEPEPAPAKWAQPQEAAPSCCSLASLPPKSPHLNPAYYFK